MGPEKLRVKIVPGAKSEKVDGWLDGQTLKIRVKSPPTDGRANKDLVNLLSKIIKCPKTAVRVKSGHTSRNKMLEVPVGGVTLLKKAAKGRC